MAIDKTMLGQKLRKCRVNLSFSIEDVAHNTAIPTKRISDIEDGLIEPSGDEILILSDLFKEDYRYFISNEKLSASEKIEVLYRKHGANFSRNDRIAVQEFIFLCESEEYILHSLDTQFRYFSPPKYDIDHIYKSQGRETANLLRSHLKYQDNVAYKDIFSEFRKIGLHIFRRRLENSNISGMYINHPYAGKCILINYHEDIFRQNFTVAHEVCHSLLDTNFDYNVSFQADGLDYREIRANEFASAFLIPEFLKYQLKETEINEERILQLAIRLKVNIQPLLIALKNYNIIAKYQYNKYINLKIHKSEKTDYELQNLSDRILHGKIKLLERGLSDYYVRNCHEAYLKNYISVGKLAEMLLVSNEDLVEILQLFKLKLNNGY
ncbi:MAG: ImmA/IrrE family metallo-endopeptidase [Prevotella sp.]|jgi:Zn-dependent peptidase ImmA (M78 family)|nr:ImmA/IrrE family metallo-endopeptidase [Prevotella sp.]